MTEQSYPAFGKVPRWNRNVVVTEKIDGTNGLISIREATFDYDWADGPDLLPGENWVWVDKPNTALIVRAGSRTRWLTPDQDNYGFSKWVQENSEDLVKLGPGLHYGEWYGQGINRGYGLTEKRFMLFNTSRWSDPEVRPESCEVSTILYEGKLNVLTAPDVGFDGPEEFNYLEFLVDNLRTWGSRHVPGFMDPEGVMIYHKSANQIFKVTLKNDDEPKSVVDATKGKVNPNA